MKTYIVEIPVHQKNQLADAAWEASEICDKTFIDMRELKERLRKNHIEKFFTYTIADLVSHVNNGNDTFSESYLANVNVVNWYNPPSTRGVEAIKI